MKRLVDLAGAGGIAALGIAGLVAGFGYGVGAITEPGPGLLPALAGAALLVLALLAAAEALRASPAAPADSDEAPLAPNAGWRVLGYAVGILAFALLMERLGSLVAVALFMAWIVRFVERQSWRLTFALTAATTAGVWLLFVKALNVTLPM